MTFTPLHGPCAGPPGIESEEKTKGGLIIPDTRQGKAPQKAK